MKLDEENRKAFKALLEEFQDQEADDGIANLRIKDVTEILKKVMI